MREPTSEAARLRFDASSVAADAEAHGLVVIAGAGISMGPPASLPGWNAINNAFLEALGMCVSRHTGSSIGLDIAEFIASRRDTADAAQPDLQAQLAEETLGHHYFALFSPLDISSWTDSHAALAALAGTGHLKAIVTTNFDRLIERALEAAGVSFTVYCSPDDFMRLGDALRTTSPLPVIKVHGSVERPDTMVDTLQQRVAGRPAALERALVALFSTHTVVVVGFSGGDLAYDPHYLGLREGASHSPRFLVVNRDGGAPTAAITDLVDAGPPTASIVDGVLPDCLVSLTRSMAVNGSLVQPAFDVEMEYPGMRRATLASDVYQAWAETMSPVRATVVLASLARAAGSDDAASRILSETMPHHLQAGLHDDPALMTQVGLLAASAVERCHIDGVLSEDRVPGEPALRLLAIDGVTSLPDVAALRALALTLVSQFAHADGTALGALRLSRELRGLAARADVVCTLSRMWALTERWEAPQLNLLRDTYRWVEEWGDEPRRARVGGWLARFLIESGHVDEAVDIVVSCQSVTKRLNLPILGNDLIAVGGRLHLATGRFDRAASALSSACGHYQTSGRTLALVEATLPLAEAAAGLGNHDLMTRAFLQFNDLWPSVPGLGLSHAATRVRIACALHAFEEARSTVSDLAALGAEWNDPVWTPQLCARLTLQIEAAEKHP